MTDMKENELLIYTDMDGTALTDWDRGPYLPARNLEAILAFTEAGGVFSVASGREAQDIMRFFPGVEFRCPLVCGNGAVVYDALAGRVLRRFPLPASYKEECAAYVLSHRDVWLVAADAEEIYQVTFGVPEKDEPIGDWDRLPLRVEEFLAEDRFIKAVYVLPPGGPGMEELKRETALLPSAALMTATQSSPRYLEMVDCAVSKAEGIRLARRSAGLEDRTLVCIGDYFNDLPMLQLSDIPACPENAVPALRDMCRIVTCDNNTGALWDLLRQLRDR